jgi:hypothetical protein
MPDGGPGDGGGNGGRDSGPPDLCRFDFDCDDHDLCTTDRCLGGFCLFEPRDQDADGFISAACGGDDCNDLNPNVWPGRAEICADGADNDCNGVADCLDPACERDANCVCTPAPDGEQCGNGLDDDCDGAVDCNDADCVGTPACECTFDEVGRCGDGIDNDCDGAADCADPDCIDNRLCACRATPESCDSGEDEDCDLLVDCADPDCRGTWACVCQPPGLPESCGDGVDNDCDALIDCADPDCVAAAECSGCTRERCQDGIDNNCNGRIDCADAECYFDPACAAVPELCSNSLDDDNDTRVDCQDPDCANNPYCVLKQSNCLSPRYIPGTGSYTGDTSGNIGENSGSCGGEAGEAVFYFVLGAPSRVHLDSIGTDFDSMLYVRVGSCDHGVEIGCDDDSGGSLWSAALDFTLLYPATYYVFLDGYAVDPHGGANEGFFRLNVEIEPNPPEVCGDGRDNDGDHYADCADSECAYRTGCLGCNGGLSPEPELGVRACTDGTDNDCDGLVDCADDDCSASEYYVTECCNGRDQNGNEIPDDFNCRCVSDADCSGSDICYTHSVWACGPPCDWYFGEICPFVAPGSYCNQATQQCEF